MIAVPPAAVAFGLPPLGAVGAETLISIAVLLMGVVGWVVQMAQQGKANNAARRPNAGGGNRAAGGGDEKLRDEIDSFLQEVAGRRNQNRPANRPEAAAKRRGPIDPFEEPPQRRRPPREPAVREPVGGQRPGSSEVPDFLRPANRRTEQSDRRPADRPERQPVPAPPPPKPPKKRADLRDRKLSRLSKKNLGGELREHVERYMAVEQSDLARQHVQVKDRLTKAERELSSLKSRLADPNDSTRLAGSSPGAMDPARLRALLSDPAGVQEAIVVNELLSKPLATRYQRDTLLGAGRRHVDPANVGAGSPDASTSLG
ncbi:hypothetical protein [Alienimonas chondri]|uniref:Uncharacterized protein n=1 Tax=Alienimonas chondri TaxID=2681879 RepID=A0ABX1VBB5_9PLAN|nr:hypothetical protein [Alienimonas chondri]NNJ24587.1 hypothetical protein [Alienimonas chondri]